MFPIAHYIKGMVKNLFNPRISNFSFVSANAEVDKSAYIYRGVKAKRAKIGAYSYIAANTDIENAEIGKFCSIADHCRIGMSSHSMQCISTSPIFTQKINALQECWVETEVFTHKSEDERVFIGNDVWIGSHVLVKGGVHIENGACVAAGAVVVKDVPPYAIVGGVPAKVIRFRFPPEIIQRLLELEWWNWDDKKLKENICFFQRDNISLDEVNAFVSNVVTKSSVR